MTAPPGSTPVPGTVVVTPAPPAAAPGTGVLGQPPAGAPAAPATAPPAPAPPAPALEQPTVSPGIGQAQVIISPPAPPVRVGGGPYTVPISVLSASGLSTVTLTMMYDATKLRVRSVTQGSFLRTGGVDVVFTEQRRRRPD